MRVGVGVCLHTSCVCVCVCVQAFTYVYLALGAFGGRVCVHTRSLHCLITDVLSGTQKLKQSLYCDESIGISLL